MNLLTEFFSKHFTKYRELNKTLDLNGVVFYLSNSQKAVSLDEKIFIQTITLEKLSESYVNSLGESKFQFLSDEDNKKLKGDIIKVLEENKTLFKKGGDYNTVKSKVLDFNIQSSTSTNAKMNKLIGDMNIEFTPIIEHIIGTGRNNAIHRGSIGSFEEAKKHSIELDKLIRRIIINLIDYKGFYTDY